MTLQQHSAPLDERLRRFASRFGRTDALYIDVPEAEAFERHSVDMLVRNVRMFAVVLALANVIWATVDCWVQPRDVRDIFLFHHLVTSFPFAIVALLTLNERARRYTKALANGAALLCAWLIGRWLGRLGGPETPWFHFSYVLSLIPMIAPSRLRQRATEVALGFTVLAVGYFSSNSDYLRSPFTPVLIAFTVFTWFACVIGGEIVYGAFRSGFVSARSLKMLVDHLEERVREQTDALRLFAKNVESSAESERVRLAHDVHDELGQELTALRFAVGLAQQRFATDPSSIAANLRSIESLVARTGKATQQLVSELRPKVLEEHGLVAALEWLVATTTERYEFPVGFEGPRVELERRLAMDTSIFRTVQEALTNVVKHAEARHAWVRLTLQNDDRTLIVEVEDDGVGIAAVVKPRGSGSGFGLLGMRERARAIDGTLDVLPRDPSGTVVRLSVAIA